MALIVAVTVTTGPNDQGRAEISYNRPSKTGPVAAQTIRVTGPLTVAVNPATASHGLSSRSIQRSINREHRCPQAAPTTMIGTQ